MIERWFPCTEVSEASGGGWGSGQSEKALFTWFAARPLAQAKAAVLTSLLPWPDNEAEQQNLQNLVRRALRERDGARSELLDVLSREYPAGATLLDPFSGRAMIPLEAARLNISATGIDYSPVANLAGELLADFPLRDWSAEPPIVFEKSPLKLHGDKLVEDVREVLHEVGRVAGLRRHFVAEAAVAGRRTLLAVAHEARDHADPGLLAGQLVRHGVVAVDAAQVAQLEVQLVVHAEAAALV